jgi:hypothetical protein
VRQLSRREVRIGIELSHSNGGKILIRLFSGACSRAEVCSPPPYFVDPKIHISSREYILSIMIS